MSEGQVAVVSALRIGRILLSENSSAFWGLSRFGLVIDGLYSRPLQPTTHCQASQPPLWWEMTSNNSVSFLKDRRLYATLPLPHAVEEEETAVSSGKIV